MDFILGNCFDVESFMTAVTSVRADDFASRKRKCPLILAQAIKIKNKSTTVFSGDEYIFSIVVNFSVIPIMMFSFLLISPFCVSFVIGNIEIFEKFRLYPNDVYLKIIKGLNILYNLLKYIRDKYSFVLPLLRRCPTQSGFSKLS